MACETLRASKPSAPVIVGGRSLCSSNPSSTDHYNIYHHQILFDLGVIECVRIQGVVQTLERSVIRTPVPVMLCVFFHLTVYPQGVKLQRDTTIIGLTNQEKVCYQFG